MDRSRLRAGELIAAVGGAALLIAMLLPWYERETDVAGVQLTESWNAWQILSVIAVLLFLIGVATLALPALRLLWKPGLHSGRLLTLLGAVGVGLVLVRLVAVPTPELDLVAGDSSDTGRGPGLFLALVATAAIAYGGRRSTSRS